MVDAEKLSKVLADAATRDGASLADFGPDNTLRAEVEKLVAAGKLHKVKLGHRTVRYFSDKRVADTLKSPGPAVIHKWDKAKFPPGAEAVITEKTKFTLCPSPSNGQFHVKQFSQW